MRPDDPYSRVDYRRLIAWPERIEREWPFFERVFGNGGRLLDLGCGTGEHARFLASKGFDVTAIDSSPAMIAKAADSPVPGNLRFVQGDMVDVEALTDGLYDGALSVGNTLPHIDDATGLARLAKGVRSRLRPGAPLLLQVLNYERIVGQGIRALPVNFRGTDEVDGEVVFLRLMTPLGNGRLVFTPTTIRYRPQGEPPVEVVTSRNVELRAWTRPEIEAVLTSSGFTTCEVFGTVGLVPYVPSESTDVVVVAR